MTSLRLAFMGTPDFAVPVLRALHQAGHRIEAVYCQPPKPAGRGHQLKKAPVQIEAEKLGLSVRTPKTLRDPAEQEFLKSLNLDAVVVAAYGLLLPLSVLDAPRLGCLNIHASLLPRWRGAAPIQRALLAGDEKSGITIMQMEAGLDTGPMLMQESLPITNATAASSLHDELAALGAKMIVRALEGLAGGKLVPQPQPSEGATYAAKLTRADGMIDWSQPASVIERQVRALTPWPGAFFKINNEPIKVLEAQIVPELFGKPGTLLEDSFIVACGQQSLRLVKVQRAGKKETGGADLLRGLRLPVGHLFT
jgi:methionyl-tRNA formyltransferase